MWKSGNVEVWQCGNIEMWKSGNMYLILQNTNVVMDLSEISTGRGGGIRGRVTFFQLSKWGRSERIESLSRGGSENIVPIFYLI